MKKIIFILSIALIVASCSKPKDNNNSLQLRVVYNGNGNTGGTVPVDANNYKAGNEVVIPDNSGNLVKTGFTFIGWNNESSGSGSNYTKGSKLTIGNSNVTLYAKWFNNSSGPVYRVIYFGNSNSAGVPPVDNTSYINGSIFTVSDNTGGLSKDGVNFKFWYGNPWGSGTEYKPGDKITVKYGNHTMYAFY